MDLPAEANAMKVPASKSEWRCSGDDQGVSSKGSSATLQPIALPVPLDNSAHDYTMGSYSDGHDRLFNPASYTHHFLGSPISWHAAFFGIHFLQNFPSAQLFSSLDNPKSTRIDKVLVMNAFNVFDYKGELCHSYNCHGTHLPGLHALLEHFEDVHVPVNPATQAQITIPFNPQPVNALQPSFENNNMELELNLNKSTQPPQQPVSSHSSPLSSDSPQTLTNSILAHFAHIYPQFQHHSIYISVYMSPYTSQPPSPDSAPQVCFPNATLTPVMSHLKDVCNMYAHFLADYSFHMPSTQLNASDGEELHVNTQSNFATSPMRAYIPQLPPTILQQQSSGQHCILPALFFSSASLLFLPPPPTNKLKLKVCDGSQAVDKIQIVSKGVLMILLAQLCGLVVSVPSGIPGVPSKGGDFAGFAAAPL
ncbi:hypothetical protein C0993_004540 [Termitomyces sp. T159_Od127]|nr:hypothetical protein C0993_004540 [Termitomyces sp. T159_Od127]